MDKINPSTRNVAHDHGESVGRTITGHNSDDMQEALRLNRTEVELNQGMWRKHMARRVENTIIVILADPTVESRTPIHTYPNLFTRHNGNGNGRSK